MAHLCFQGGALFKRLLYHCLSRRLPAPLLHVLGGGFAGEAYRLSLEIIAKKNKLEKNAIFYNGFVDLENLKEFIGAAQVIPSTTILLRGGHPLRRQSAARESLHKYYSAVHAHR